MQNENWVYYPVLWKTRKSYRWAIWILCCCNIHMYRHDYNAWQHEPNFPRLTRWSHNYSQNVCFGEKSFTTACYYKKCSIDRFLINTKPAPLFVFRYFKKNGMVVIVIASSKSRIILQDLLKLSTDACARNPTSLFQKQWDGSHRDRYQQITNHPSGSSEA